MVSKPTYICEYCKKEFKNLKVAEKHEIGCKKKHDKINNVSFLRKIKKKLGIEHKWKCAFCGKEFNTKEEAESHEKKDKKAYKIKPPKKVDPKIIELVVELNGLHDSLGNKEIVGYKKLKKKIDKLWSIGEVSEKEYGKLKRNITKSIDMEIILSKELKKLNNRLSKTKSKYYDEYKKQINNFSKIKEPSIKIFNNLLEKIKSLDYKCDICGKNLKDFRERFTCQYCHRSFCSKHRIPENHSCEGHPEVSHLRPIKYIDGVAIVDLKYKEED